MKLSKAGVWMTVLASGICMAQQYVPPPPPLTVDPCMAVANPLLPKDPSAKERPVCPPPAAVAAPTAAEGRGATAADKFPFMGQPAAAEKPSGAEQFPYPGSAPAPAGKAADPFPYPGETGKSPDATPEGDTTRYVPDAPAADGKAPPNDPDAGSSSSSSSSSSGSSSSGGDGSAGSADDAVNETAHGRSHGRRALPKVSAVSPEDRVSEDLDVAKFYSDRGNFEAAYLRAKDATKLMPEDAESHFALAQAAEQLKRKDEAAAEYALYLKLDPAGQKKTVAERALSQMK